METRLSLLQKRYRTALSGAVVAKARYLALSGERFANPAALERAKWKWARIEARRQQLADELAVLRSDLAAQLFAELRLPVPPSKVPMNATLELAL